MVFIYCGLLAGHRGWVTCMVTPPPACVPTGDIQLISASRDRSAVMWRPIRKQQQLPKKKRKQQELSMCSSSSSLATPTTSSLLGGELETTSGQCRAEKKLEGHAHFIVDIALSDDGTRIATASWDTLVRVWRTEDGICARRYSGHSKDVNTVTFLSGSSTVIASAGKDASIIVWDESGNVVAKKEAAHNDWVSCVRPMGTQHGCPVLVSIGWDGNTKIWSLVGDGQLICLGVLHTHPTTAALNETSLLRAADPLLHCAVSPDYTIVGTVSKGGVTRLWDVTALAAKKPTKPTAGTTPEVLGEAALVLNLQATKNVDGSKDAAHQICFAPHRFYVCIALDSCVRVFDISVRQVVAELVPEVQDRSKRPQCISLAWTHDGSLLYTGYTDNTIRMWGLPNDDPL